MLIVFNLCALIIFKYSANGRTRDKFTNVVSDNEILENEIDGNTFVGAKTKEDQSTLVKGNIVEKNTFKGDFTLGVEQSNE